MSLSAIDTVASSGGAASASWNEAGPEDALAWAAGHIDVEAVRTVTARPWSAVHRIDGADGRVWLKRVPPVLATNVAIAPAIASIAVDAVPKTLAYAPDRGWLLQADHGARDLRPDVDEATRTALLVRYASLQAKALGSRDVSDSLVRFDAIAALRALLDFLSPVDGGRVDAERFLSSTRTARYRAVLSVAAPTLETYLAKAKQLPATLEHFDLRPSNVARRSDGSFVFYDWEEAVAAPVGLSLHGLFGGAAPVLDALAGDPLTSDSCDDPERIAPRRRALDAYIHALAIDGYSDETQVRAGIGASTVAGVIGYLSGFARFDSGDAQLRRAVRRNLRKRMGDLLDVCHRLALEADAVLALQSALRANGWQERADALLAAGVRHRPDDPVLLQVHAERRLGAGAIVDALAAFDRCVALGNTQPAAYRGQAECHARRGNFDEAMSTRQRAFTIDGDEDAKPTRSRLRELSRLERAAAADGRVPTLVFDDDELATGQMAPASLALAERLFRRHGVLLIKRAFDPSLLSQCHSTFLERYERYLAAKRPDDALRIGDKRLQVTIDLEPPYDAPALYANALVLPLMQQLLGKRCTLGCYTSAMSLPGAAEQRLHKDHKALFEGDPDAGAVPTFAITLMLPLVSLDERVGTTRVRKGSHRLDTADSASLPTQTPLTTPGDCYLMDYRLSHYGQANRSEQPRPILSLVYQRPWFRDFMNFTGQPSLRLDRDAFERMPEEHRSLLAWTLEPGALRHDH